MLSIASANMTATLCRKNISAKRKQHVHQGERTSQGSSIPPQNSNTTVACTASLSASSTATVKHAQKRAKLINIAVQPTPSALVKESVELGKASSTSSKVTTDFILHHTCSKPKITYHQLAYYVRKYLGDLDPEFNDALVKATFSAKINQAGTLANGVVRVGISTRSGTFSEDEDEMDEDHKYKENDKPVRHTTRMLGLFSTRTIQVGDWVTAYGGVQSWACKGKDSVKVRPASFNTHVRRIPRSDSVLDGRPFSMLFPRVFSNIERGAAPDTIQEDEKKIHVEPIVSVHSLVNVLLRLHHEATEHFKGNEHYAQYQHKQRQSCMVCKVLRTHGCQGTCTRCRDAEGLIQNRAKADHATLPSNSQIHSQTDMQEYLSPSCTACNTYIGMLPCEVDTLLCSWSETDRKALHSLCFRVQRSIQINGLGYMANTDSDRTAWNVRVVNVNPYKGA